MGKEKFVKGVKKQTHKLVKIYKEQNLLITTLYAWLIFLIYEVTLRTYNLYESNPSVDVVGHFLAGIAMAATLFWLFEKIKVKRKYLLIPIGVLVISLLWELLEKVQEKVFFNPPALLDVFVWDGIIDTIMALIGAGLYLLIKYRKS